MDKGQGLVGGPYCISPARLPERSRRTAEAVQRKHFKYMLFTYKSLQRFEEAELFCNFVKFNKKFCHSVVHDGEVYELLLIKY